jgi:hypothetical protein
MVERYTRVDKSRDNAVSDLFSTPPAEGST